MSKVLHLIGNFKEDSGGAQRVILDIINACTDPSIKMGVCSLFEDATLAKYLPKGTFNSNLNYRFKKNPKIFFDIYRVIKKWDPDILHVHSPVAGLFGRPLAHFCDVNLISTVHLNARFFNLRNDYINKYTLGLSDKIICVSDLVEESIRDKYSSIIENANIHTVPNCIDCAEFLSKINVDSDSKIKELNLTEDDFLVGNVGRLHSQKGQKFLLQAWQSVVEQYSNAKLLIIGEGPERDNLESLCRTLDISDSVLFLGARSDVPELLNLLDIFILPSIWEGLPISLLEAMCAGKVIVASDIKNIRSVLGDAGLLVEPKNSSDISKTLLEVIGNYEKYDSLKTEVRQRVNEQFSPVEFGKKYTAIYQEVLSTEVLKDK